MNLQGSAQNRVLYAVSPALSEQGGKGDRRLVGMANRLPLSLLETMLAKEAKTLAHSAVEIT